MQLTDPKYAFLHIRCSSRLPANAGYSAIRLLCLDVESDDVRFPEDLVCTDLNNLWLQSNNHLQQLSSRFFDIFVNLGLLMLQNVHFLSEQFSLQPLAKLKVLIFDSCDIRETDVSLFPKNLRTLCIWGCRLPNPLDLPNLENLQKLDIQQELPEVIMVPNAISNLSSLEELHIPNGFRFSDDAKDIKSIFHEISKLTCLTSLKIFFSDFEACRDTSTFFKLLKYDISVGQRMHCQGLPNSTRMIELAHVEVRRYEALRNLMKRAEEVRLLEVDISSIWNSNREAYTDLRKLTIDSSLTLEYIARIPQGEIQHSRQHQTSFSKLTILKIESCPEMKYLFCKSVAKCLVQLQQLVVHKCPQMEVIVTDEGTRDGEIINFSKIKTLELTDLESLRSFYRVKKEMHWGPTENSIISSIQSQTLFDGTVAFPSLEELSIWLKLPNIWGKHYCDDNDITSSSSFCKLKRLEVGGFRKLESIIPYSMLKRLRNLEDLEISYCSSLREIIGRGEKDEEEITDDHGIIVFPQLTELKLVHLENLTSVWCYQTRESHNYKVEFPSLVNFELECCGELNLESIKLGTDYSTCQVKSINIIRSENQMQLPSEWKFHLYNLETMTLDSCWWHNVESLCFPKLKELKIHNCISSALFTISGFRSLQQLRTLEISDCALLEKIVEDASRDEQSSMVAETFTLLQLYWVVVKDLPKLKNFINGASYECYMPVLKKVEVEKCGLFSLFTCSVFINLQQLQTIEISNCAFLEEIVKDVRGGEHAGMDTATITLLQLHLIVFDDLPNLRSFSRSVSYAFNMPKSAFFWLLGCPLLENFTYLKTSTGLVLGYTEEHEGEEVTDLNSFIIQNRKRSNLVKVLEDEVSDQELETESGMVEEEQQEGN